MSTEVLVLGFDCVPSFHSGEVLCGGRGFSHRSSESEPEGNLDGFLALERLKQDRTKNKVG